MINRLDTSCRSRIDQMNKDTSLLWRNEVTSRIRIFLSNAGNGESPSDVITQTRLRQTNWNDG